MKPHAHIRMLTHSNMQTQIHIPWESIDMESTWDQERGGEIKKRRVNWHQRNVLKTRHCKLFLPCTVAYAVRMCTSTLSGWKQHPLQSLCICSLHLKDTESFISSQIPNWGMQRAPERCGDGRIPHILLRITEGRVQLLSWLVTPLSVSGLWWNLTEY